jgi:hypothetical protein
MQRWTAEPLVYKSFDCHARGLETASVYEAYAQGRGL